MQACPQENVGILRVLPAQALIQDRRGSGIGRLMRRPDVAALALILVFGAFVNAAGMTEPVMMWMHHLHALEHARLGLSSMVPIVSVLYACGLLIIPAILAAACGWAEPSLGASECRLEGADLRFHACAGSARLQYVARTLLEPSGGGMERIVPAVERFFSRVSSGVYAQAWVPVWMPSVDLLFLDLGLLLTLYVAWRVARQVTDGKRMRAGSAGALGRASGRAVFGRCLDRLPAYADARNDDDAIGAIMQAPNYY